MKLLITHGCGDDWLVWGTLPDHDAIEDAFGFVVGVGSTRDSAVADAIKALEAAAEELQAPPGQIEEREL